MAAAAAVLVASRKELGAPFPWPRHWESQRDKDGQRDDYKESSDKRSDVYRLAYFQVWFTPTELLRAFGLPILNNSIVRGCKIHVSMAKYEKRRGQGKHSVEFFRDSKHNMQQTGKVWRKKNEFHDNFVEAKDLRFSQEDQRDSKILQGEVNSEFISWLNRSLVCTSDDSRDLGALASASISGYGQCTKIYSLSSFKFILTFPTVEQMEEALNNYQELDLWFSKVKRWDRILIREISPAIQAIQTVQITPSSPSMEAMDSNEGALGFEEIEDDVTSTDVAEDDSRRLDTVATEDDHQANGSPGDSLNSTTITRIANFSQNEKNKKTKTTYKRKSVASKRILTRRRKILQSSSKSTDNGNKTLEGTRQLARDALEIGKILGVVVIDKEDAAIKRITTSLKKERKPRAQERTEG
ncbi:hypothetical protein Cgig2_025249 [Carnegiea gigantea]|uniref:Uncharacterized protein n=1 Tax=Carnegiea gigantea TaxID=171969 RepID=A0A9Q1JKM2_9CARY|nr:hypothetical protein Cgig2_025249 [Carnegiea gigantea]